MELGNLVDGSTDGELRVGLLDDGESVYKIRVHRGVAVPRLKPPPPKYSPIHRSPLLTPTGNRRLTVSPAVHLLLMGGQADVQKSAWLLLLMYIILLVSLGLKTWDGEVYYIAYYNSPLTRGVAVFQIISGLVISVLAYVCLKAYRWVPNKPSMLWLPLIGLLSVQLLAPGVNSSNMLEAGLTAMTYTPLYVLWHAPFEICLQHTSALSLVDLADKPQNLFCGRQLCGGLHAVTLLWILFLDASRQYGEQGSPAAPWLYLASLFEEIVQFEVLHLAFSSHDGGFPPLSQELSDTENDMLLQQALQPPKVTMDEDPLPAGNLAFGLGLMIFYLVQIVTMGIKWECTESHSVQFDYQEPIVLAAGIVQLLANMVVFGLAVQAICRNSDHHIQEWRLLHYFENLWFGCMLFFLLLTQLLLIPFDESHTSWLHFFIQFVGYSGVFLCWIGGADPVFTKVAAILHLIFLILVVGFGADSFLSQVCERRSDREGSLMFCNTLFEQMLVFELLHRAAGVL
eukprot:g19573.t1